jgi:D-3-phosphoglycerate dehydrogenase / 2-oxoglutarate reductase
MKVLITDHHYTDIAAAERLLEESGVELVVGQCSKEDEAIALGRDAEVIINQHLSVDARMLEALPRCLGVVHFGKGVDNIDVEAATQRGIWVAAVRDANWDEVSNHVLALMLAWARGLLIYDRHMRAGGWSYRAAVPRRRLAGQVLGLVGFGDIARVLAGKAHCLGLSVLAYARRPTTSEHVDFVAIEQLLQRSDYVSIHVPLSRETAKLIGRDEIALIKPTAFLINTARGGVVDQKALVEALKEGRLAGAGLDVTDPEPPGPDDELLKLDNVILTPHSAWYSQESMRDVTTGAAREALRILKGKRPASPVNPEVEARARERIAALGHTILSDRIGETRGADG